MRAPKIVLWFIVIGLPVLFLAQLFGQDRAWAGVYAGQQYLHNPEIKQSRGKKISNTDNDKADTSLSQRQAALESQFTKPDDKVVSKATNTDLHPGQLAAYSICGQYITWLKSQSADYQQRACDLYELLIFPYHWFW